jgi:hypothetical protein
MTARRYRLRVFDDGAPVLAKRDYAAFLDLDTDDGIQQAQRRLDDLAVRLARADGASGKRIGRYYLSVLDIDTNEHLFDWPAKAIDF